MPYGRFEDNFPWWKLVIVDPLHHETHCFGFNFKSWLGNAGKAWLNEICEWGIIKNYDGKIIWHSQSEFANGLKQAFGHSVRRTG